MPEILEFTSAKSLPKCTKCVLFHWWWEGFLAWNFFVSKLCSLSRLSDSTYFALSCIFPNVKYIFSSKLSFFKVQSSCPDIIFLSNPAVLPVHTQEQRLHMQKRQSIFEKLRTTSDKDNTRDPWRPRRSSKDPAATSYRDIFCFEYRTFSQSNTANDQLNNL